jgi:hypothetical protein
MRQPAERIAMALLPALAPSDDEHFIVAKAGDKSVLIHDLVQ